MPDKGPGRREDFNAKPGGSKQDSSRPGGAGRPTGENKPKTKSAAEMSADNGETGGGGGGGGNSGGGICGLIMFGGAALLASGIFGAVEAVRVVL